MSKNYKNGNNFTMVIYLNVELNSRQIHRDTFSKLSILSRICQKTVFYNEHGMHILES